MWQRARERAREILRSHRPPPLPPGVDEAIRDRFEIVLPPALAGIPAGEH